MSLPALRNPFSDQEGRTFSQVLESLGVGIGKLSVGDMVDAFAERGFGALILLLSLLALLPWPPGSKSIFAAPIILLSIQLIARRDEPWLPRWALKASVGREAYRKAVKTGIRPIRYVENLTRPRWRDLTGEIAQMLIGGLCIFLAVTMALPVPFGDMLPGLAMAFLALGLMQRDGLAVLVGGVLSAATVGYLFIVWKTVVEIFQAVGGWLTGLF